MSVKCTVAKCHAPATHTVYWPHWESRPEKRRKYAPTRGHVPYCGECAVRRATYWRTESTLKALVPDAEGTLWDE